jgi:hypothetical protein
MADITDLHLAAASARTARDSTRLEVRQGALRLHAIEQELARARRGKRDPQAPDPVAALEREQAILRETVDAATRNLATGRDRISATLHPFFLDPENLVAQLDDSVPFLLFPVRIETKFAGDELRVRIFPDDIAVAHHEKALTVGEKDAGERYWGSRLLANGAATKEARETLQRDAWNRIASRYGAYRASWIARATQPDGWTDTVTDPDDLTPRVVETKPLSWSDTPRSPVMPDMFAVVLELGGKSRTVFGNMVPDDLPLGPDPLQAEGFLTRDETTKRLKISDDLLWLIDFKRAESAGMGVRIPLTRVERIEGFDRILVLGLRLSTDRQGSAVLLSRLVESHRYSQGMSIVPQGTPTNNTDDVKSGLTPSHESVDETYALEHDATPYPLSDEPMRQLDGERLAVALGLPIDVVRSLPNARGADIAESVAMSRALWSATLGSFVDEMLQGTFSAADVRRAQLFLNEFVHGRGLVPAIRVGAQPYGIVITSALDSWQWSDAELGDERAFWVPLQEQLVLLRNHWRTVAAGEVSFVGKRDAKGTLIDPFATMIDIIGLQASSVEFWSRTGVPDTYVKALAAYKKNGQTNDPDLVADWFKNAKKAREADLMGAHVLFAAKAKLLGVLFMAKIDRVTFDVVDGDPAVPLSETRTIRPYDGVTAHNYIYWLATGSSADIQYENFRGADGKPVPAPTALLYKLLRVGSLAEIYAGSRRLNERVRPDVFLGAPRVGDIVNVAEPVLMPAHFASVDTAKIGLTRASITTGDYLLSQARAPTPVVQKPPEAAALSTLTEALTALATLPTARLERLLAEHIDVVSYRLDAWLMGLFARRLASQRRRSAKVMGQTTPGTYLGAYGWVLDVRPAKDKRLVEPAQIPNELRDAVDDGPVVTYANNGGFVQAPSLPHAVTAAVLRNAYLTHAEPEVTKGTSGTVSSAERMSVNLSSARVRTALAYIDGLQNGQELGALLGYQLERGLHERHPGVELDRFIYTLRARFPLISRKLTPTKDGSPAEVLEARNVVNGYDLIDFVKDKTYDYGIAGLPRAEGSATERLQAGAIEDEVNRLRDSLDAVADLLLAEGVHQVVQGNYARARGAVQALTDGELPPLPDVIQTPRMGKSLTHRVALFLKPAATAGWPGTMTPRATANAPLNHWLTTVLPQPEDIQWMVKVGTNAAEHLTVKTLGLQPLDLVLMSGDRVGDLTSPLEQLLIRDLRARGVADDVATYAFKKPDPSIPDAKSLVFDPNHAQPGRHSLGSLLPLLKALRRLVTSGRRLGAKDLMRPTEAQSAHPDNPNGYDGSAAPLKDLAELKARVESAHAALTAQDTLLQPLVATMQPLVEKLEADADLVVQPQWTGLIPQLRKALRAIVLFGVPEAMPSSGLEISRALVTRDAAQAEAVQLTVARKLAQARTLLDKTFTAPPLTDPIEEARAMGARVTARLDAYTEAARLLLGSELVVVPLFAAHAETLPELTAATASPIESDPLAIESWLQSIAHVRPAMQAWDLLATYHGWLRDAFLDLVPLQLPNAPGAKWIGGVFDDTVHADDVVSIAAHDLPASFASPVAGLLVDEWTELVPSPNETTGIAMHVNRPNAVAPQALLLAVAPKQTGRWALTDLIAILEDTIDRARLRAVEPDDVKSPYFQLLPPIVASFDDSRLMAAAKFSGAIAFSKKP